LAKKLSNLFSANPNLIQPDAESKCCVKFEAVEYVVKIEAVECEPTSKKAKIDLSTAASDDTMEDDVWVKCDRHILKNADKECIETGMELTDKPIQYSQYLIKKQLFNNYWWSLLNFAAKPPEAQPTKEFLTGGLLQCQASLNCGF